MNNSWSRKPFDEVFEDVSGGNVKTLQSTYLSQGEYPIVDQGKTLVAGFTNDAKALCKTPSPVIVFGDHTRILKFIDFPFCMGADGVKVLKPKDGNDPKYLFHYLQHIDIPSAGYDRHFKYLKRLQIASPPLDQQRRIAAILDQAEALRTKRRQALAKLDTLTQSLFLEMFGDPRTNSKGLTTTTIGRLLTLKSGNFLPASQMKASGVYPVYGGNGINGRHDEYMFEQRVISIGRVGAYCGVVHLTEPKSWVTDNSLLVAGFGPELSQGYLFEALKIANLNQYASQSGQPLISASRLSDVRLLIPPIPQR